MLTSLENPKVKQFHSLKQKKQRKADGKFLIEGVHLISEAMQAGLLDKVIYSEKVLKTFEGKDLIGKIIAADIPSEEASVKVISYLSDVENPQGVFASVNPKVSDLSDLLNNDDPLIVIACGIQDPGNLGTLIRTCDAAGCSGLIISQGTVDIYNDKVIRASSGSIFHLNIIKIDDIIDLIPSLKRRGIKVFSSVVGAQKDHYMVDWSGPIALIIGSEAQGIAKEIERLSDGSISIPMVGKVESLNAAVSGAIILYEAYRQREINAGKTD
jgi:TrmH family RNA methyltransferase